MPNIYWSKNAIAQIGPSGQSNFTNAREAAEDSANTTNTTSTNAIVSGFIRTSSRGGAAFGFRRSYWGFDFTGYTAGTITNLDFNYTPSTGSTGTLSNRLAQFNGFGTEVGSNYSTGDWWDSIENPLVPYSNAFNSPDSSTVQAVTLNSTAITDAGTDGFLKLVLMNTGDYNGIAVGVDQSNITNWNVGNNSTGNIYLSFDYEAPGYGNKVNSILPANVSQINGISNSNISQVIGV
tara:strand:- start:289 stop:996 length:708 start_codon:yes stop_codon:yes gene_type:complete